MSGDDVIVVGVEIIFFFFLITLSLCLPLTFRDEILTRPIFGNRVQQPHLQNLQKNGDDAEPKDLRPEDLLSVEEDMDDDDMDDDLDGSIMPKEEPIDIDDMEEIGGDVDNDRNE